MSLNVSSAQDYSVKQLSAGSYTYRKVYPEGTAPVVSVGSTVNADYLLPNQVLNLYRSFLCFDFTIAGAANTKSRSAHNGFLAAIDGIVLSNAAGTRLVELNNIPQYTKLVWKPLTLQDRMLTHPCHSTGAACATAADCLEYGQMFNRIRTAIPDAAGDGTFVNGAYIPAAENGQGWVKASDDYTAVATHITRSGAAVNTAGQALAVKVRLPLHMFYGSMLAVDKDLYFNEQLRLTVRWNQANKFGWETTDAKTAVENDAKSDVSTAPTLSNTYIHVAVETNDAIAQAIKESVLVGDGINVVVPFTYSHKATTSATAGASNSFIRKLNRGHGSRLLRVVSGVFSANEVGHMYCNNNNLGTLADPLKWKSVRTYLDSKPLTEDYQLIADSIPYLRHSDFYKGSCIKDLADWSKNAVIIEDFTGIRRSSDIPDADNMISGIDLSLEREFMLELVQVPAAALNVHMFSTCQKSLSINKSGISIM